jgi:hypothetical protein
MIAVTKRDILGALIFLAAGADARAAVAHQIDLSAGRAVGEAYLAARPEADVGALAAQLLPSGFDDAALPRLRQRAADDFRSGRTFTHNGWILSETEAQLFALLAT